MIGEFGSLFAQISFFVQNVEELYTVTEGCCSLMTLMLTIVKIIQFYLLNESLGKVTGNMISHNIMDDITFLHRDTSFSQTLRNNVNKIMKKCWDDANLSTKIFFRLSAPVPFLYSAVPLALNIYNNYMNTDNYKLKFPYKTHYPYMEELKTKTPWYQIFFLMETSSGFYTLTGLLAFDGFYVYMTMYATGLVNSLNEMIVFSTNECVPNSFREQLLKDCVRYQVRVLRFCDDINDIYAGVNLMQLFMSTLIICVIGFHATSSQGNNKFSTVLMIIYLVACIYQLGIYCYFGQKLRNASMDTQFSCYNCNWCDCSKEFKSLLRIIMLRAEKPINIVGWPLFEMSLETFSVILRSAGSYYTILRTLVEN